MRIIKVKERVAPELKAIFDKAINLEQESAHLYESMSVWCDNAGFKNQKKWFSIHAQEERKHGQWVMDFLMDKNCMPVMMDIKASGTNWKDLSEVLTAAYKHEELVTDTWNKIATECLKKADHDAYNFALKLCKEQREEIDLFSSLIDMYNLCEGDSDLSYDSKIEHP